MARKKIIRGGAILLVLGGLAYLLWSPFSPFTHTDLYNSKDSAHFSVKSRESHEASAATKSGVRTVKKKVPVAADAKEVAKFRRFYLPPLKLENASLEEAMARIVAAYREAALATGQTPLDLQIDLSQAAQGQPITCTTPRAPAGSVIRFVAGLTGNKLEGALPGFRLVALDRQPDRSGKIEVPPDLVALLRQSSDASLSAIDASERPKDSLLTLLFAHGYSQAIDCQLTGSTLSYENFSEAELNQLQTTIEAASGGEIGPVQSKSSIKILDMADAAASIWADGTTLDPEAVQQRMRQTAQVEGTALVTMPQVTSRPGETATIELIREVADGEGGLTWTGQRVTTQSIPYGLGNQIEMTYETRETADQIPIVVHQTVTLPERGSGVGVSQGPDGKKIVVIHEVDLVDATGRPIAGQE